MAILKELLYRVKLKSISGDTNREIGEVCFDSRKVVPGALFIAVRGTQVDGHQFIEQAIKDGADAIIAEKLPDKLSDSVTYVETDNSAVALGFVASNYFDNPSQKLQLVAVTGTNGKTTTVTLLHQLFEKLGYNAGLLSTVENKIKDKVIEATHTTPDAIQLNRLLQQMVKEGCTHCFMEASSHAIVQERVAGLKFSGAVFTNISRDHLDFHKTFKDYINAKKKLFDELSSDAFALINKDDKQGPVMVQNCRARVKDFSLQSVSDYQGKLLSNTLLGLELEIQGMVGWFKMIGKFNAYNLLATFATAELLGESTEEILIQLSDLTGALGRFERVYSKSDIVAIVDYAHTPDALENVLKTISDLRTGNEQLVTVVGCGGNRDKGKRPEMAKIAVEYSDKAIFTSDNPRNEDPEEIILEMKSGVGLKDQMKVLEVVNRREAIKTACSLASNKDIILVAGKGHENYQEIKGIKHPFDDRVVLTEILNLMYS